MSFSFSRTDVLAVNALIEIAGDMQLPSTIKGYLIDGVMALQKRHGSDVRVNVNAYGHLHNGAEGNYDVTSATITVQQATAKVTETA